MNGQQTITSRIKRAAPFAIYALLVALCSIGVALLAAGFYNAGWMLFSTGIAMGAILLIGVAIASAITEWRSP